MILVQDRRNIMRMHALHGEGDNAGMLRRILGTVDMNIVHLLQTIHQALCQLLLLLHDVLESDFL